MSPYGTLLLALLTASAASAQTPSQPSPESAEERTEASADGDGEAGQPSEAPLSRPSGLSGDEDEPLPEAIWSVQGWPSLAVSGTLALTAFTTGRLVDVSPEDHRCDRGRRAGHAIGWFLPGWLLDRPQPLLPVSVSVSHRRAQVAWRF